MTTTTEGTLKIVMSERSPLRIVKSDWPIVAEAKRHDGAVEAQANTEWAIRVREHRDGRRIVYGSKTAGNGGQYAGFREARAGFLVAPSGELVNRDDGPLTNAPDNDGTIRAIRRVAGIIDDDQLGDECIAELPAEELT